MIEVNYIGKF